MRVAVLLLVLSFTLVACAEPELSGFVREPVPSVGSATLPDVSHDGEPFELRAEDGQLLLVYFGYTACPDVCPFTLSDTRWALSQLGDDAEHFDVAVATVDPTRDTVEVITGYVQGFFPDGHALRTEDDAQLESAATLFGASYSVDPDLDGEYVVTHTGSLYAVDDQGDLLITWPFGTAKEDLAQDLEILVGRL